MKINNQNMFENYDKKPYSITDHGIKYVHEGMVYEKLFKEILDMVGNERELIKWHEEHSFASKVISKTDHKVKLKNKIQVKSLFASSACVTIMIASSLLFQFPYNLMAVLPFSAPLYFNSKHIWDNLHDKK